METEKPFQKKPKERISLSKLWQLLNTDIEIALTKIATEKQINEINKLKRDLGWKKLPYNTLDKFIQELNYPHNVENAAINLLRIVSELIYPVLKEIKEEIDPKMTTHIDDYLRNIINFSDKYQWVPKKIPEESAESS